MSLIVTLNGANYIIPEPGETGWGSNLDAYFVAIAAGCLQKTGGSFTLSAETDFGASFGLKSLYYKSRASNLATTGAFRLANAETGIVWRNFLNNADLALTVNTSDQLQFNGHPIASTVTAKSFLYGDASGNIAATSNPTNGQLLIGSTGNIPAVSTLTGTTNQVTVSNGTGTITLGTPQDIAITSNPTFLTLLLNDGALPKLTVAPSGVSTSTIAEIHAEDVGGAGLHIRDFGTGISATINGRSAGGNAQINCDRTLFVDVPTSGVISFGANNTEVGFFSSTGLHLPTPLEIASGGTAAASFTAYAVICGGTTSTGALQSIAGVGSAGQVLTSNGAGTLPTFQNVAGTGTVNSGTAGRLSLYATSTNAVSDTYVQNANNINVVIAAHAALSSTRTYTIPELGTNGTFGFLEGTQTFSGAKTFSATTIHSATNPAIKLGTGGTSDATNYQNIFFLGGAGGSSVGVELNSETQTAITTAKTIYTRDAGSAFCFIYGSDGAGNDFTDFVFVDNTSGGSTSTLFSGTAKGTPSARTYSQSGINLQLAMASGTYTTRVLAFDMAAR